VNDTNLGWMKYKGPLMHEFYLVQLSSLCLVRGALLCGRSCDASQSDNRSSYCHGSIFQHHDPVRNYPRPSNYAQMPDI